MNQKVLKNSFRDKISKRTFRFYLLFVSAPIYLYHSLEMKDFWALLFISCIALYAPILWSAFFLYVCYKVQSQYRQNVIFIKQSVQNIAVESVRLNQINELIHAVDADPEILYCDYQRKSLIAWCRHYKNNEAQVVVTHLMEKYPNHNKKTLAA